MEPLREEEFTTIPNFLLKHPGFTQSTILLLMRIRNIQRADGACYATNRELADYLGQTQRQVQRHLESLKSANLLTIEIKKEEGNTRRMRCEWGWGVVPNDIDVVRVSKTEELEGGNDIRVVRGAEKGVNTEQNKGLFPTPNDIGTYISVNKKVDSKSKSKRNKEVEWTIRYDGGRLVFSDRAKALAYYRMRYPMVDVEHELGEMEDWLKDAKPKKNYHLFILNWCRNSRRKYSGKVGWKPQQPQAPQPSHRQPPRIDFDELLRKGRQEGPR